MSKTTYQTIREILERVSDFEFVPHIYIGFSTDTPGVVLPEFVRERYPNSITIVLNKQFRDLVVFDDRFEVVLNFDRAPYPIVVPLISIFSFHPVEPIPPKPEKKPKPTGKVVSLADYRKS